MDKSDAYQLIERLEELKVEIESKVGEFRDVVCEAENMGFDVFMANLDAYVFEQLNEHIDNGNPYNQSLQSIINNFNNQSDNDELYEEQD